jgi:transcriptional regulator NrdR family protein
MNGKECPACGAWDTERVHTEWYQDMIEETRICENCPTQYTNSYSLFDQSEDGVPT